MKGVIASIIGSQSPHNPHTGGTPGSLPPAQVPPTGSEFSEIVQEGVKKRIDDNDRVAGQLQPKPVVFTDPYDDQLVWSCDLDVTPRLHGTQMPGFFYTLTRQGSYNPYGEEAFYLYSSFGNTGAGFVASISGDKYTVLDTSLSTRGISTTVSRRASPVPFDEWSGDDTSASIFLDCASALPTEPTEPFANAKMIFPFRVGNMNVALIEPLVQTSASAVTLTPERLTEIAEFTNLLVDATVAAPSGAAINGKTMVIRILASGADRALTWDAYYRPIGVTLPLVAPAGKWVYVTGYFNEAGAKFDVVDVRVEA